MEFRETPIAGAVIVVPNRITDERGHFGRAWCQREFADHGLNPYMTQLNAGFSRRRGTLRGLHYQAAPDDEAKFVRCTRGAMFDVVVDLRPGSATCGQWFGLELDPAEGLMVYVPEGCAHGYLTLQDDTEMYYLTSAAYAPASARGVRFDDPAFGITWPAPVSVVSDADRRWPDWSPPTSSGG